MRSFANKVIQKLKEEGNEIFIVTSRTDRLYPNVEEQTYQFLERYAIAYDALLFDLQNKEKDCIKYGIDLLIDDNPKHCKNVAKLLPIFYFANLYNLNIEECENVYLVYGWIQIYEKIQKLAKNETYSLDWVLV